MINTAGVREKEKPIPEHQSSIGSNEKSSYVATSNDERIIIGKKNTCIGYDTCSIITSGKDNVMLGGDNDK